MKLAILSILIFNIINVLGQSIDLKIMSFNVQQPYGNNWDARKDSAVAIINIEKPDIIGTQEAVNYQRDYLMANIKGYSWFGKGRDGGNNGEGSWIFYKTGKYEIDSINSGNIWLSNTPNVPSRFGGSYNRIATYIRLIDTLSGKGFYIFNIHNYMPEENSLRLMAAKLFVTSITKKISDEPLIVTGDFNSPESDAVTKWMKSGSDNPMQFRDTYRDVYPNGSVTTGFGTKFDYIYCANQPQYTTKESKVIAKPSNASDHMPIVATVSIAYANGDNLLPKADAGEDQILVDSNADGIETVTLNASNSKDPDGSIISYEWFEGGIQIAEGSNPEINLAVGNHPIYLIVKDSLGAISGDQVTITINKVTEVLNKTSNNDIKFYPSPVEQVLHVNSIYGSIERMKVYNSYGIKAMEITNRKHIDMSSLIKGVYFIEATIGEQTIVKKIIKI